MNILDDMGVSKLSAKVVFFKVNYSFNSKMYDDTVQCIAHSLWAGVLKYQQNKKNISCVFCFKLQEK